MAICLVDAYKRFERPSVRTRSLTMPSNLFASRLRAQLRGGMRAHAVLLATAFGLGAPAVWAESHALIMWISDYGDADANLPGLDNDARNARRIAIAMGVPESRITELKNQQLTLAGISAALRNLAARIQRDDRVILYFSGHGTQLPSRGGSTKPCSEGIVAQDRGIYYDQNLVDDLQALGAKASQVVMLNDSCFSGGQATRQVELTRGQSRRVPKYLPLKLAPAGTGASQHQCGDAVNKSVHSLTRNIEVVRTSGAQLLYVAAAGADEVSYATSQGSPATQAWADCLAAPATDRDRSGSISGEELRLCAQAWIDRTQPDHQTISLTGNPNLPITLGAAANTAAASATVDAPRALADLRATSDAAYQIVLRPVKSTLKIGQDLLEFTVESNREGYLYVLQVGSEGKTYNLLFPNRLDTDNHIAAGAQRLPHDAWRLRSGGPEGVTHLLALVSSVRKDFAGQMDATGTFAEAPANGNATRTMHLEAVSGGRFGTSDVVQIREVR
jgi:hypothetical protein